MHVAVMTMVRNETDMLPRWCRYYGNQVGARNLVVLDDQSTDGSTAGLDCTVLHMPVRGGHDVPFATHKSTIANKIAAGLLEMYDFVIFTDVDEFIVPDPRRYVSLVDYVTQNADVPVIAPIGMNLVHMPHDEPPLDPQRPLLAQRRHVKLVPRMCKPAIKRVPVRWSHGTHGVARPFEIRSDIFLVHAKFADFDAALRVHTARHAEFVHRGSGSGASWRLPVDDLAARYASWVSTPAGRVPSVADFDRVDVSGVVRQQQNGIYCSMGGQLKAMERGELLRLPDYVGEPV
jgi:hypothetical protein